MTLKGTRQTTKFSGEHEIVPKGGGRSLEWTVIMAYIFGVMQMGNHLEKTLSKIIK